MNIVEFLSPADVIVEDRALDKVQLLKELSRRAAANLHLSSARVADAILKREKLGSTGIGGGVAIPHGSLRDLKKPFGILVRLKKPIDFAAVDDLPVDIVFLLLAPATPQGDQLNALACMSRTLRNTGVVSEVRRANDSAAVFDAVILGSDRIASTGPKLVQP